MRGKYHLKKKMFYTYLQIRNHYEHNIKNKTDFNDQNKKSNTTEYIKEKWEREGNLSTSSETWLDMCRLPWKCTNSNSDGNALFISSYYQGRYQGTFFWREFWLLETVWFNHWRIFWNCSVINPFGVTQSTQKPT